MCLELIWEKMQMKNVLNKLMKNLLLSSIILFLYSCSASTAPAPVAELPTLPVIQINAANAITTVEYPASIEGATNVEIRPQVDGFLDKLFVDEGAYVTAGQPLFKINDLPYIIFLHKNTVVVYSRYQTTGLPFIKSLKWNMNTGKERFYGSAVSFSYNDKVTGLWESLRRNCSKDDKQ